MNHEAEFGGMSQNVNCETLSSMSASLGALSSMSASLGVLHSRWRIQRRERSVGDQAMHARVSKT
jgi:hypothetical protein